MLTSDSVKTPIVQKSNLDEDLQGKPVDVTQYRGMIGSLMYLTSNRPDHIYGVCLCALYQEKPTEKHLHAVKQIFRYLKGTINMGLWYSKDTVSTKAPTRKSKRVKRPTKKSTKTPARGVVIIETLEMPLTKKKEKVDITQGKLKKNHQKVKLNLKEMMKMIATMNKNQVMKTVIKRSSYDDKTQSDNENESDSEHETDESESGSESDHDESEKDKDNEEAKSSDKAEGDEEKEMDYTTSQLYDDMDIRLNEPVDTDEGFVQEEGTDAVMTNVQQGNENPEILQVIEDAHVTLSTIPQKTKVLVTSSSLSFDLASKFLNFSDIPHSNAKLFLQWMFTSNMKYQDDPLKTQVTALVDEHLDARLGATRDEFMNFLSASITARITEQVKNKLPQILPKKVSNFAPLVIQSMVAKSLEQAVLAKDESYLAAPEHEECYEGLKKSYDLDKTFFSTYGKVYLLKKSRKGKDEDRSAGSDRGLKKRKTSKDAEPSYELKFEVANSDMPHDQEENLDNDDEPKEKTFDDLMSTPIDFSAFIRNDLNIKNLNHKTLLGPAFRLLKGTHSNYVELKYDSEECYKAFLEKLDWENPKGSDYTFDHTKPLPLVKIGNCQKVLVDYFFNNNLKYLQGGISTMTYTTSLTKAKAAHYDLPGIEDMVLNIWSLVKVTYDKHALWGISHWREQRKTIYAYARGMQSRHDVYSTKRILAVTKVDVMKKHGGRNRLMRSDKLFKFRDGTLTRLRTSLGDITKNIRMEYLPNRRWSTLEKKRSNIMIKAIENQLKERRMMRSLKKFVGGRDYKTNLLLLQ
nr:hypothetical protein [Tanacetum cinerariifolium]